MQTSAYFKGRDTGAIKRSLIYGINSKKQSWQYTGTLKLKN